MDFEINYIKSKSAEEAYQIIKSIITDKSLKEHYKVKAKLNYNDSKLEMSATGKGFDLKISFSENTAFGNIKLGLLLRPLGSSIVGKITKGVEGKI